MTLKYCLFERLQRYSDFGEVNTRSTKFGGTKSEFS